MKKIVIIWNPLAADGHSAVLLRGSTVLDSHFERIVVPADNISSALRNTLEIVCIVIVGGDGTVNRCLETLAGSSIPIAVFPAGTVNDLALELRMTASWENLLKIILQKKPSPLRLLEVNGHKFAVYGSLGLGAETTKRLRQTRGALKTFRHAFPTLQTPLFTMLIIFFTRDYVKRLRLTFDGKPRELRTPGIYVVNQRYLNRRVDLEWDRSKSPQQFRMIVFKPIGTLALLRAVMRFNQAGRLSAIQSVVDVFDVENAVVESLDGSSIHFIRDGEPGVDEQRLELRQSADPLQVYRGGMA